MAASDKDQFADEPASRERREHGSGAQARCLSAEAWADRLAEEIHRAARCGTSLSCLLVAIEGLDEPAAHHAHRPPDPGLAAVGPALRRELRPSDSVACPNERELLVVLPGADGPHGEIVARRLIAGLHALEIEAGGVRRSPRVSVGLAAWREDLSGEQLMARARAATRHACNGAHPAG